jgi:hypothetical protein
MDFLSLESRRPADGVLPPAAYRRAPDREGRSEAALDDAVDPQERARQTDEGLLRASGMNRRGGRQGGWVGMIAVLLALLIVAWLARDALKQYALVPRSDAPAESAPPTGYQRSPTPAAVSADPPLGATPSFQAPVEQARGVGAASQPRRLDDAAQ